jgi:type I restriction enzyme S subunit
VLHGKRFLNICRAWKSLACVNESLQAGGVGSLKIKPKKGNGVQHTLDVRVPRSWEVVPLEKVLDDIVGGGTPPKAHTSYWEGSIPWLTVKDMRTRRPEDAIDHISDGAVLESATNVIPADTVIIASRIGLGKVIRVPYDAAINQDLKARINKPEVDKGYLEYWIVSIAGYLESIGSGTTVKGIRLEQLRSLPFPLAPLNEQNRIVAEIEKQFSRLDEAVENLKRVKANLKRYKASVLKAAVEGKLTEEWRKKHPDVEPADKLLERILSERRKKWEKTELARMKAKGKKPKDDKWKKRYKEASQVDESLLPDLPNGWAWANLPQLGELNRGKSKHRPRNAPILYGGHYPFVQTGDVRHATGIIKKYTQTYSEEGLKQSRLWPKGTLCITIAANIADTALLGFDACFPDSIVGFIPENENIDVRFVEYFIRTAKEDLERYAPATAQKNINLAILSDVAVPLPPKKEQHILIDEIEKCITVAEGIVFDVEQNMLRADRLRQSILKKAFTGKLVSQNNIDESIENPLERYA